MSSSRLSGTTKPKSINVNSVYPATRSTVSGDRAAGPISKNALQTLGKPTSITRRMPPPATLKSLKAEHGFDSGISLIAQTGGQGWNKSIENANDSKSQSVDNPLISSGGALDLRPTWAKSAAGMTSSLDSSQTPPITQSQMQRNPVTVAATTNNREFPTLAASLATSGKQSTIAQANSSTESIRPQRQADEQNADQEEQIIPAVPPPPISGSKQYIGATIRNDINRKLPKRFAASQEAQLNNRGRYDVRQKLAQLSMESKESLSTPTEKSMDRQASVPVVPEDILIESDTSMNPAAQTQHQQIQPLMQKDLSQIHGRGSQEIRSQDVRQYYPQLGQTAAPQPLNELPDWNRGGSGSYENDYSHQGYRNDVSTSSNVTAQQSHGRDDTGQQVYRNQAGGQQMRGAPIRLGGQQRPRYEYPEEGHPPPLMSQRVNSNSNWDEYDSNGPQWNAPDRPPSNRASHYRGESRGNSESESGWYSSQQPHSRRNDPNGWNYSLNEHDNYHRAQPGSNRSRTTSNSYAEEYDQGMYPSYSTDNERRYKNRPKHMEEQNYDYYPEEYGRQKYNAYETHQPAYRMLKRNDEKSAEYFSNQAANADNELADEDTIALSQLTRSGRSSKPINFGSINSESPEIVSSDTFDSSTEHRKTPQLKFNRAPGAGKPQQLEDNAQKSMSPAENVWKKRMETQKSKEEESKVTWQNVKHGRKFDHNFPPISDKKSDSTPSESEPLVSASSTRPHSKQSLNRHSSANQRAPSKWDDPPLTSWNDDYQVENKANEDETYEGSRRQFYNSQRSQRSQTTNQKPITQDLVDSQRRQPSRKKRNEPEDNFSNMGEFHAEDYKIEEVRPSSNKSANRFDNGFDGKPQKDDNSRSNGGRQAGSRKAFNSDERTRQSKSQRTTGTRTWQRQPKSIAEEQADEAESTQQRSSNSRPQRQNGGSQSRPQQANRRNANSNKNLTPQSADHLSGKPTIKSPARSENGFDEWETASESSDLHGRKTENIKKSSQIRPKTREKTPRESNGTAKSADGQIQRSSAGQKNVKPASHTFHQNNGEFVKNRSDNSHLHHKNTNESKYARGRLSIEYQTTKTTNGLAGVDINDASVEDQTQDFDSVSDGEFEEVISRKVKRQRQIQQQQEEERAQRERQKLEQRQRFKEEKQHQRKLIKKKHENSRSREEEARQSGEIELTTKMPGSISPISASDSGVVAKSTSPQLILDGDNSSLQSNVNVSIPAQHPVWNSPSPQVANPATTLPDEPEPQIAPTIKPIARPKQRIDNDTKTIPSFGNKTLEGSNYSFGYEHSIPACDDDIELQEKLNMAKIKDFWPGEEPENYISSSLFKQPISVNQGEPLTVSSSQTVVVEDSQKVLQEEPIQSKTQANVNRQYVNKSPLNSNSILFGARGNVVYQMNNVPYSPLLDNSMRDFLNGPPFAHANTPPAKTPPTFIGNIGPNTAKVYSNEWPTNNTDLLNNINSTSPLNGPSTFSHPKTHQPMPLNYNVPPPPISIGKFTPNFPPPNMQDFRFPPPYTTAGNGRNQINFNNPPPVNSLLNNGSRPQLNKRPSNGRQQNSSPIISAPSPFFAWNAKPNNQQQTFGLF